MNQLLVVGQALNTAHSVGRRSVLAAMLLAGLASPAAWADAATDAWPGKPVRVVVPFPSSGATDLVSRVIA